MNEMAVDLQRSLGEPVDAPTEIAGEIPNQDEQLDALKQKLDSIQKEAKKEVKAFNDASRENYYKSRLRKIMGNWACGKVLASYFTRVNSEKPNWSRLSESLGHSDKTLKRWHDLFTTHPEESVFLEAHAKPKAQAWTESAFHRVTEEEKKEEESFNRWLKERNPYGSDNEEPGVDKEKTKKGTQKDSFDKAYEANTVRLIENIDTLMKGLQRVMNDKAEYYTCSKGKELFKKLYELFDYLESMKLPGKKETAKTIG